MKTTFITQIIRKSIKVDEGQKIKVWDQDDRMWIDAKITDFLDNGKFRIKCKDGMKYDETRYDLEDRSLYNLAPDKK